MAKRIFLALVFLSVLIVISISFYWFEWRPSAIRETCVTQARKNDYLQESNNIYRECLSKNGMKPEDLYVDRN